MLILTVKDTEVEWGGRLYGEQQSGSWAGFGGSPVYTRAPRLGPPPPSPTPLRGFKSLSAGSWEWQWGPSSHPDIWSCFSLFLCLPCELLRGPDDAESPPLLLVVLPMYILGLGLPRQGQLHLDVVSEKGTVEGPADEVDGWLGVGSRGGKPGSHSGEYSFISCVSSMVCVQEKWSNISTDQAVGEPNNEQDPALTFPAELKV